MSPTKTYLFGYPLNRTYAPFLHNTIYQLLGNDRTYEKCESKDLRELLQASRSPDFAGSAVTMPHKVAVCQLVDELTPEARCIGACNTIYWEDSEGGDRKLVGHNTDTIGIRESILRCKDFTKSDQPRPGLIVGGGGAARAAIYSMATYLNCTPIYIVNRDEEEVEGIQSALRDSASTGFNPTVIHVKTPEQAQSLEPPQCIVSAIPCFPPVTEEEKRARATLVAFLETTVKGVLLEMCYFPKIWTAICELARSHEWTIVTGEVAMVWQGVEQQKIWLGLSDDELPVAETLKRIEEQLERDSAAAGFA